MSRSWPELRPERIRVAFAPAALGVVRARRDAADGVLACAAAGGAESWRGALDALAAAAAGWRARRADVTVVLSNHFVRYALVPREAALRGAAEELAYARHAFSKTHGERSGEWEVRLDREARGPLRVACAIDGGLRRGLQACFPPGAGARLVSVQPYLMSAFNRLRRRLAAPAAALLLVEPGRACLGRLAQGCWTRLSNLRGDFEPVEAWSALLEREQALAGDAPEREVLVRPRVEQSDPYLAMAQCAS